MPKAPQVEPDILALLKTAEALARIAPRLRADVLQKIAALAILRKACLTEAAGAGEDWKASWALAQSRGCPLLDSTLDPKGSPDPARACAEAHLPEGELDLGALHLALRSGRVLRGRGKRGMYFEGGSESNRRAGAFYTPTWMAERLAGMLLGDTWSPRVILDPACGDGRLLVACAEHLSKRLPAEERRQAIRERIAHGLCGVEQDPLTAALARTALWRMAGPEEGPVEGLLQAIVCGDAIAGPVDGPYPKGTLAWRKAWAGLHAEGFDALVANPPFEVLTGFDKRPGLSRYVDRLRKSGYRMALGGTLNTYRLFLERATQLLVPEGRMAIVLPLGFLMDRTASPLRVNMLRSGWIEEVEIYPESARAFASVGQATLLMKAGRREAALRRFRVRPQGHKGPAHWLELAALESLDPEHLPVPAADGTSMGLVARMHGLNESRLGDFFLGRVGEVDQTVYKEHMLDEPGSALLVRGTHLAPFRVELGKQARRQGWLDADGFAAARGGGAWREDIKQNRVVQTGIVNMEAQRRLVAAEVPAGVRLGNSVNYWVPVEGRFVDASIGRGYALGLLNAAPLEWRFRLTSSNNNINLYEIRELPLPHLVERFQAERMPALWARCTELLQGHQVSPLTAVRQVTSGWGAPARDDRAVVGIIAAAARLMAEEEDPIRLDWLQIVLDHFVN
ncbi:MAG: N-6 DNA methylase, partial [Deltaproteobacteria bacterium]|nr:N-6 DNA methylase [Deltaproteobacteria bacterium]